MEDNKSKAEALNKQFQSVFTDLKWEQARHKHPDTGKGNSKITIQAKHQQS